MEMTPARATNKSMSVTIPAVRVAVDVSNSLSAAERPRLPFGLKGMAEGAPGGLDEGDVDGATEGTSGGTADGLVVGAAEGELEGFAAETADGATEGMIDGAADGLVVGAAGEDTEGSAGSNSSPGLTKSGRSHREG